ncbi:AAA family ATPase [Klebsiella pneumoniae]|uniref:AAA family ATPase n=1 Tax=Klebsiella pneumoniae TaxID=573 RepID=UPI00296EF44A|nr:AAA family ATPase [Klebsiella pneumoniae]
MVEKRGEDARSLIIGFEEPEIYLHPSAANQMRDIIYDLSGLSSQIITTHSPPH